MRRFFGPSSPLGLLRLYMTAVLAAGVIAVAMVVVASSRIDDRAEQSGEEADAAITSARTRNIIGEQLSIVAPYRGKFFAAPEFLSLPPDQRAAVARELTRDWRLDVGPVDPPIPPLRVALTPRQQATLQTLADELLGAVDVVLNSPAHVNTEKLSAAQDNYRAALAAFNANPILGNDRYLTTHTVALGESLGFTASEASAEFARQQSALKNATSFAALAMILALVLLTAVMAVATLAVGRLIQRAFSDKERETEALRVTTDSLRYRNSQLNALYNVFSEITDTFNLPHVVNSTLRETLKLVPAASRAILSLLRDNMLVPEGSLQADGTSLENLPALPLGEGLIGRTAKRGRTLRIDSSNEDLLMDLQRDRGEHSGLIVPLIVGARVVGTLSCWSAEPDAFSEEDERILEMMASQIATAVIAADTTESSERRAQRDALTGLPNRLQLAQELAGDLADLAKHDGRAVVAMVDIDHFKRLNDKHGHRVGDVTLQKVASLLRGAVRDHDRVYRYGGEEFVMIFLNATSDEAKALADRVRSVVESTPLPVDGSEPVGPVTISIGLAVLPEHSTDLNHLIDLADAAMYQAKQAGRNRVVVWTERDDQPATLPNRVA